MAYSNKKGTHDGIFDKRARTVKGDRNLGHPHQLVVRLVKQYTETWFVKQYPKTLLSNIIQKLVYHCIKQCTATCFTKRNILK